MDRPVSGPLKVDFQPPSVGDRAWMARALERAREAWDQGEVPVGAVLVRDGAILSEASNNTIRWSDPTAHAEVVAIRKAAIGIGDWRLQDTTLYVTLEPCAQCAGAIILARISRLVYATADPKSGMVGSLGNLVQDPRLNHRVRVTTGVFPEASAGLLREFFRERRPRTAAVHFSDLPASPTEDEV